MQSCHSANFPGGIDEGESTFIHIYIIYIYMCGRERGGHLGWGYTRPPLAQCPNAGQTGQLSTKQR